MSYKQGLEKIKVSVLVSETIRKRMPGGQHKWRMMEWGQVVEFHYSSLDDADDNRIRQSDGLIVDHGKLSEADRCMNLSTDGKRWTMGDTFFAKIRKAVEYRIPIVVFDCSHANANQLIWGRCDDPLSFCVGLEKEVCLSELAATFVLFKLYREEREATEKELIYMLKQFNIDLGRLANVKVITRKEA